MARKDSDHQKKYIDPSAPYDGYEEDDDTEENVRHVLLGKVKAE